MEILIPLGFFAMIAAIVLVPNYLKSRDRQRLMDTVRTAYDRGQPVPPELIQSMQAPEPPAAIRSTPERDLRGGVIWLAVGIGIAIFGWLIGFEEDDVVFPIIGAASIPAMIGLALITLGVIGQRSRP